MDQQVFAAQGEILDEFQERLDIWVADLFINIHDCLRHFALLSPKSNIMLRFFSCCFRRSIMAALLLSLCTACSEPISAEEQRPNIILILIDDMGWADLGCYGADLHETPHIDRFAKSSVRFTTAYASAPICSPTRASILTGKHPARLNMTIWREGSFNRPKNRRLIPPASVPDLSRDEQSLGKVLQAAGYLTIHLGKWHLGEASHFPETHGFDVHLGGNHWGAPATHFFPYRGPAHKEFRYIPHLEWGKAGEYLTDRLTDEAIRSIERASAKDQPFFLNLWHYTVHTPLEAPQPLVDEYDRKKQPGQHHQNPTYAAMVKSLDDNIGRLMNVLETKKLLDNTVIVFTSDNGGYLSMGNGTAVTNNHPLRLGKGSCYEGGIRVPMLVRWPGVTPAGTECHQPVVSADLYPTLLEIAQVPATIKQNTVLDGVSLTSVLKNPSEKLPRETLYWHYPHYYPTTTPVSAVRSGDWKLLEYYEDLHTELYNLKDDLSESLDLSAAHPEQTQRLKQLLAQWKTEVHAALPEKNPEFKP